MRYICAGNLFRRINSLKPLNLQKYIGEPIFQSYSSNAFKRRTHKHTSILSSVNEWIKFEKLHRNASNKENNKDMARTGITYTLLGAGIFSVFFAYLLNRNETKSEKMSSPVISLSKIDVKINNDEEEKKVELNDPKLLMKNKENLKKQVTASETTGQIETNQQNLVSSVPNFVQYIIVGGGTAALAAFKAIRVKDPKAKVLVVTEESYKPYMRPPLSKELWMTEDENLINNLRFKLYNGTEKSLHYMEDEFYVPVEKLNEQENGGVSVLTGKTVEDIDIQNKTVRLNDNWMITFDKCLIATGGKPKNLPVFKKTWNELKGKVTLFRNIDDFKNLYSIVKEGKTIAVIGGGFLGSELACALSHMAKTRGGKVIQIFPESGNLGRILPEYLSQWTTKRLIEEGVEILAETIIEEASLNDQKISLKLAPSDIRKENSYYKNWLLADHVVVAVGLDPNVQLAKKSGFEVDSNLGGYVVNAELQARNSIWVAGDAACFYDTKLGRRRVEHHDHAVVSGRLAGENMTGACKPYWHQSMFWSDLGPNIGFEAIGLIDSSLQTVGLFAKANENDTPAGFLGESNDSLRSEIDLSPKINDTCYNQQSSPRKPAKSDEYGKGVVFYLKDNVIVGCLLWNVFKCIPIARQLIQSQEKIKDYNDLAKLFQIDARNHEE